MNSHAHDLTESSLFERTATAFWSLGASISAQAGFEIVHHPTAPGHALGNFITRVRDRAAASAIVTDHSTALPARLVIDTDTPPPVEAAVALADWTVEHLLLLALPATTTIPEPHGLDTRAAEGDADWQAIEHLFRIDHLEEDARHGVPARPLEQTRAAVDLRRALGPGVDYLLAERDGATVSTIAVWVSGEGIGVIEDVFVHPRQRGMGTATQMLRHAVARARARGAGSIMIGAEADDTPKHLYHAFGFRPVGVQRSYTHPASAKQPAPEPTS
ncbi:GNAT family N-acetyltransferase [Glycomyces sp. TRM65418]|uniref:GNAT family N-acetyltransferase n=1 Tax=Glycomyces sp. TRM65418 TaxID=2867006 RepID=UPI001CE5F730|nr:GNAT family N-acetyltransferase [Glycomyces sp. TRM65418]MCC3765154.1 GNAT family N-acetyltransferase [Glycomyces sp. TRM65418]QZD54781.1 GNAT family N-acetyltransferase [Glycomyces sp. TRM65418]